MKEFLGIVFCLILGLLIYLSLFYYSNEKKNNRILTFINSFTLVLLIILTFFRILPTAINLLNNKFITSQSIAFIFLICIFIFFTIKLSFNNNLKLKYDEYNILICLSLYYLLDGFNLYYITTLSIKSGILNLIKFGIQNISLGILFINLYKKDYKKMVKIFVIFSVLPLIGGLISYIFTIDFSTAFVFGIINALVFSLTLYIIIFNLLKEYKDYNDTISKAIGIIFGGALMLIINLF